MIIVRCDSATTSGENNNRENEGMRLATDSFLAHRATAVLLLHAYTRWVIAKKKSGGNVVATRCSAALTGGRTSEPSPANRSRDKTRPVPTRLDFALSRPDRCWRPPRATLALLASPRQPPPPRPGLLAAHPTGR